MRILLLTEGTAGYVLPLVKLGGALRRRGHHVTLAGSGYFRTAAEQEGLELVELLPAEEYGRDALGRPSLGQLRRFVRQATARVLAQMEPVYRLIAERHVPGETVIAAQCWVFAARIAQEKLGVPLATVHVPPILMGGISPEIKLPRWLPRLIRACIHWRMDHRLGPGINAFRAQLGLPPVSDVLTWWHSPQCVIGLFPAWFAAPQADWPPNVELVGFPSLERPPEGTGPPDELEAFLAEGDPPLLFSQGSKMTDTQRYFAVSAEVAHRLGKRAVLFTSDPSQVPAALPPGVRAFGFVPFRLPRRAAAHVHHGGIGTIAYTLAAGVPQLTMPTVFDQFDNSERLERLGVSAMIRRRAYRPERAAQVLKDLIESPDVAERCRFYAARCREANALDGACDVLEQLHAKHRGS